LGKIEEKDKKKYKKNILRYAIGIENLNRENIFVQEQYIHGDTNLLLCSDGLWEKINIDENIFVKDFDELKEAIYAVVPTDNVTVIRYFPIKQLNSNFEVLEEEFVEEYQKEEKKIESKVSKKKVITSNKDLNKKIFKDKKIKKVNNQILISIAFLFLISIVTYLLMAQIFNSTEQDINISREESFFKYVQNGDINKTKLSIEKGVDINSTDENNNTAIYYSYENMDINMSLFLIQKGICTKRIKQKIQFDINQTEIKLKNLKTFNKRLHI